MKLIIAVFLFNIIFAAEAAEGFEFKGMALESSFLDFEQNPKFNCRLPQSPLGDKICTLNYREIETIAGVPVAVMTLFFYDEKLSSIRILIKSHFFYSVRDALIAKYGNGAITKESVQNRAGASFENEIYIWNKEGQTLTAKRYDGKISTSLVVFELNSYVENYAKRRKTQGSDRSKDL